MAARILDVKTKAPDGYFEYSMMRGCEMVTCEDKDALIQAFIGELKTNVGECYGTGQSRYGSDLKRIIGESINLSLELEITDCIRNKAAEYPYILSCDVNVTEEEAEGLVHIKITLDTIFGIVLEVLDFTRGC